MVVVYLEPIDAVVDDLVAGCRWWLIANVVSDVEVELKAVEFV